MHRRKSNNRDDDGLLRLEVLTVQAVRLRASLEADAPEGSALNPLIAECFMEASTTRAGLRNLHDLRSACAIRTLAEELAAGSKAGEGWTRFVMRTPSVRVHAAETASVLTA